jgi:hypothetical protein
MLLGGLSLSRQDTNKATANSDIRKIHTLRFISLSLTVRLPAYRAGLPGKEAFF